MPPSLRRSIVPSSADDVRAKRLDDACVALGARGVDDVRHAVGIDHMRALRAEHAPDLALAAGDTAREADGNHGLSIE